MKLLNHLDLFDDFSDNLGENDAIYISDSALATNETRKINVPAKTQKRISKLILDYYSAIRFYKLKWRYGKSDEIMGTINIIPLKDSLKDTRPGYMHNLWMLDYFIPEACIGFFMAKPGQKPNDELYYLYFEDEPEGLNVDMDGYMQLLYKTRGFAYWQLALLFLQTRRKRKVSGVEEFKKYMPIIFPDFKWDEFVALYEQVKLR